MHAEVLRHVANFAPSAVVFDFDFSRPKPENGDEAFRRAIEENGRVVLFETLQGVRAPVPDAAGVVRWARTETSAPPNPRLASAAAVIAPFPLPKIEKSSWQFWVFKPSFGNAPTTAAAATQMTLFPYLERWLHLVDEASGGAAPAHPGAVAMGGLRGFMQEMRAVFLADPELAQRLAEAVEQTDMAGDDRAALSALTAL